MKKQIKVKFCDFNMVLINYGNWILKLLKKKYDVIISDQPDYVFYSIWGLEHLHYDNAIKIFYSHEGVVPDFNDCDYAISMNDIDFNGRNMRLRAMPYIDYMFIDKSVQKFQIEKKKYSYYLNRRFCNFIYSANREGDEGHLIRNQFCKSMMDYKKVDCPGIVMNNMTDTELPPRFSQNEFIGKLKYLEKYKFTIAFEGTSEYSYTTERLMQALLSHSIPIYWGNPLVYKDYNTKAFINCNDYNNDMEAVLEEVKRLDNDDDAYLNMLSQPPMAENYDFEFQNHLEEFIYNIIENGVRFNKNHSYWSTAGWLNSVLKNDIHLEPLSNNAGINETVVIYGSGNYGNMTYHYLNSIGKPVKAICDSSIEKIGNYLLGHRILSPMELQSHYKDEEITIIIAINNKNEVEKVFRHLKENNNWNFYKAFRGLSIL